MATKQRCLRLPDSVYTELVRRAEERRVSVARVVIEDTGCLPLVETAVRAGKIGAVVEGRVPFVQEVAKTVMADGFPVDRVAAEMSKIVPASQLPKPKPVVVAAKGATAGIAPDEFPDDDAYVQTFADE